MKNIIFIIWLLLLISCNNNNFSRRYDNFLKNSNEYSFLALQSSIEENLQSNNLEIREIVSNRENELFELLKYENIYTISFCIYVISKNILNAQLSEKIINIVGEIITKNPSLLLDINDKIVLKKELISNIIIEEFNKHSNEDKLILLNKFQKELLKVSKENDIIPYLKEVINKEESMLNKEQLEMNLIYQESKEKFLLFTQNPDKDNFQFLKKYLLELEPEYSLDLYINRTLEGQTFYELNFIDILEIGNEYAIEIGFILESKGFTSGHNSELMKSILGKIIEVNTDLFFEMCKKYNINDPDSVIYILPHYDEYDGDETQKQAIIRKRIDILENYRRSDFQEIKKKILEVLINEEYTY